MRCRWRGPIDSAASAIEGRALTSITASTPPRRATMSISPKGVTRRRARIR